MHALHPLSRGPPPARCPAGCAAPSRNPGKPPRSHLPPSMPRPQPRACLHLDAPSSLHAPPSLHASRALALPAPLLQPPHTLRLSAASFALSSSCSFFFIWSASLLTALMSWGHKREGGRGGRESEGGAQGKRGRGTDQRSAEGGLQRAAAGAGRAAVLWRCCKSAPLGKPAPARAKKGPPFPAKSGPGRPRTHMLHAFPELLHLLAASHHLQPSVHSTQHAAHVKGWPAATRHVLPKRPLSGTRSRAGTELPTLLLLQPLLLPLTPLLLGQPGVGLLLLVAAHALRPAARQGAVGTAPKVHPSGAAGPGRPPPGARSEAPPAHSAAATAAGRQSV